MQAVVQTLMGALGAVGFAVLFNVRGRKLVAAAVGAAISWIVYLVIYHAYGDMIHIKDNEYGVSFDNGEWN